MLGPNTSGDSRQKFHYLYQSDTLAGFLHPAEPYTPYHFKVTGILLDKDEPGMDFSLKAFCQDIYRTSQLLGNDIVRELVTKRV